MRRRNSSNLKERIEMVLGPCFIGENLVHSKNTQTFFKRNEIMA